MRLPARCQGLHIPAEGALALELYALGEKAFLYVASGTPPQISLLETRPDSPPITPFGTQLRRLVKGRPLLRISTRGHTVVLEFGGAENLILLFRQNGNITIYRGGKFILGDRRLIPPETSEEIELSQLSNKAENSKFDRSPRALKEGRLRKVLKREIKKSERKLRAIESDAARAESAGKLRLEAETLLIHRHRLKSTGNVQGRLQLETASGETLEFVRNPKATLDEEIDGRFHQAKRLERGYEIAIKRAKTEKQRLERLRALEASIGAMSEDELDEAMRSRQNDPDAAKKAETGKGRVPYRTFRSIDGFLIHVGRSARDNDQLTMKLARPHDLFFHLRGAPGSHVIVQTEKRSVPHETLLDAAMLAHHFSTFAKESSAEIQYTERRYIRKPRGSADGAVRLLREKTLLIQRESERLQRLLGTEKR